jgi:small subunit ribosomal protein S7
MRKAKPKKRVLLPDPKFHDVLVTRFVNNLMYDGRKSKAFDILYNALDIVGTKMKDSETQPLEVFKKALENITPQVEVKSRRVGGATFSRKRSGKGMSEKLAAEIMAAFNEEGAAFKRKEDMHKMAEANKAFAHFRF